MGLEVGATLQEVLLLACCVLRANLLAEQALHAQTTLVFWEREKKSAGMCWTSGRGGLVGGCLSGLVVVDGGWTGGRVGAPDCVEGLFEGCQGLLTVVGVGHAQGLPGMRDGEGDGQHGARERGQT